MDVGGSQGTAGTQWGEARDAGDAQLPTPKNEQAHDVSSTGVEKL